MPGKRELFDQDLLSKVSRFKPYEKEGEEAKRAWKKIADSLGGKSGKVLEGKNMKKRTEKLLEVYQQKIEEQKTQPGRKPPASKEDKILAKILKWRSEAQQKAQAAKTPSGPEAGPSSEKAKTGSSSNPKKMKIEAGPSSEKPKTGSSSTTKKAIKGPGKPTTTPFQSVTPRTDTAAKQGQGTSAQKNAEEAGPDLEALRKKQLELKRQSILLDIEIKQKELEELADSS